MQEDENCHGWTWTTEFHEELPLLCVLNNEKFQEGLKWLDGVDPAGFISGPKVCGGPSKGEKIKFSLSVETIFSFVKDNLNMLCSSS